MKAGLFALGALLLIASLGLWQLKVDKNIGDKIKKFIKKPVFHGLHQQRQNQIFFYDHKMTIDSTQQPSQVEDEGEERIKIFTNSRHRIEYTWIAASAPLTNLFLVSVQPQEYHMEKIDIIENNVISNYDYSNSNEDEMDIEYVVTLDGNNGNIINFNKSPGPDYELLTEVI